MCTLVIQSLCLYIFWQKISSFIHQSKEYLIKKAFDKIPSALQMISDALSISIYSDNLMAMKAEALLLVCMYGKLILPCAHHY
jgi:DnaJ family protein C protein 7